MRKSISVAVLVIAGLMAAVAIADKPQGAKIGATAPQFSLPDQNDKAVNLSDYSGKIVVLEWVNPGCPFVKRHGDLNTMKNLEQKYKDKGVAWIGINSNASGKAAENKAWIQEHGLDYPILSDKEGTVGKAYGATNTPHMFIIDKGGSLAYAGGIDDQPADSGPVDAKTTNYVDKALGELTSGKSVSTAESKAYGCGVHYAE